MTSNSNSPSVDTVIVGDGRRPRGPPRYRDCHARRLSRRRLGWLRGLARRREPGERQARRDGLRGRAGLDQRASTCAVTDWVARSV